MMTDQERKEKHMKYGLAICAHSMGGGDENDELFFTGMNQINEGGAGVLPDPTQRGLIATLNLKAGKRATILSDWNTAFNFYRHGISFLDHSEDHWETQYNLRYAMWIVTSNHFLLFEVKLNAVYSFQRGTFRCR